MTAPDDGPIRFKRNHFSTRLPREYVYTLSHYWLTCPDEKDASTWRVGLTGFATRMLGEIVEFEFEVDEGQKVEVAQALGWIEGFKAVSDIYSVAGGEFAGVNPAVREDPELICKDPYGDGWLFALRGTPDPKAVDVEGYVAQLHATIDKMLEQPWRSGVDLGAGGADC